jgi:ribonucleoside-diphosphate reductase alpha chain
MGITVYRSGSREMEVLTSGTAGGESADAEEAEAATTTGYLTPRDRPAEVSGVTRRVHTGHGNIYVTVNANGDGRPFEVFATAGKAGGCDAAQHQAIGRMVSLALRSGIDPEEIVKELRDITCCPAWDNGTLVRSGPDAIALALDRQLQAEAPPGPESVSGQDDGAQLGMSITGGHPALGGAEARVVPEIVPAASEAIALLNQNLCPECKQPSLAHEEGCLKCYSCGYSKC